MRLGTCLGMRVKDNGIILPAAMGMGRNVIVCVHETWCTVKVLE
jgi:hypothetical protein